MSHYTIILNDYSLSFIDNMTSCSYIKVNDEVHKLVFYKVQYVHNTSNKVSCHDLGLFLTNFWNVEDYNLVNRFYFPISLGIIRRRVSYFESIPLCKFLHIFSSEY